MAGRRAGRQAARLLRQIIQLTFRLYDFILFFLWLYCIALGPLSCFRLFRTISAIAVLRVFLVPLAIYLFALRSPLTLIGQSNLHFPHNPS